MAVLITGLGYIGSALARRVLAEGAQVVAVENFFSTPRSVSTQLAREGDLTLIEGSIDEPSTLQKAFAAAPIEIAFNLAAQASAHPDAAPLAYTVATNFVGTQRFVEACADAGVPRLILASSTRLYAPPLPRVLSEQTPIHAPDLVHLSQLFGETLVQAAQRQHPSWRASVTAVRIGTVHGLGPVMKQDPRFLAAPQRFCWQAARGETLQVDTGPASLLAFAHLDDVVDGLLHCARMSPAARVVNLAAEVRPVLDVALIVQELSQAREVQVTIHLQGRTRNFGSHIVESALAATGFVATIRLEDSLGPVLDHYLGVTPHAGQPSARGANAPRSPRGTA